MAARRPLTIDDVIAKQEIQDVLHRYCRSMDRIDDDLARSVWHDDGTAHYSGIYEGTGHGFVEWVSEFHKGLVSTSHQITTTLIEVDGDRAGSEAYVTVRLRFSRDDDSRFDVCGTGRYLDRWSRRDGVWAVDHRVYVGDQSWIEEVARRSGVAGAPGADRLRSAPNRADPSYDFVDPAV
ncbi:MAG: nuclear transport factor 2 family protein [Actinomycetota bacterium]